MRRQAYSLARHASSPNAYSPCNRLFFSTSSARRKDTLPDARWIALQKARIGRCLTFGLREEKLFASAAAACSTLGAHWREFLAGSEGFLTDKHRRGFHRRPIDWGEQDSMGHVNNVTYFRYAESARINWASNYALVHDRAHGKEWAELWSSRGTGFILRSIRTDFKFPMTYPDAISVYHKLQSRPDAGHDSFKLEVLILSEKHKRPAARCFEDIVLYDYKNGKKVTFEAVPFALKAFQETFDLQEQAAIENRRKAEELEELVKELEHGSWDRSDAQEAFGAPS